MSLILYTYTEKSPGWLPWSSLATSPLTSRAVILTTFSFQWYIGMLKYSHTHILNFYIWIIIMQFRYNMAIISINSHDDVIKWKRFPRYWPFVRGIHRWPVNSPHKGQWRGALMFSLIWAWINGRVNNREAGDLRHHRGHYDVTVMMDCVVTEVNCIFVAVIMWCYCIYILFVWLCT